VAGFVAFEPERSRRMPDFLMIALGVGFFVAGVLYVLACEKM
jgi:hypothetical protein